MEFDFAFACFCFEIRCYFADFHLASRVSCRTAVDRFFPDRSTKVTTEVAIAAISHDQQRLPMSRRPLQLFPVRNDLRRFSWLFPELTERAAGRILVRKRKNRRPFHRAEAGARHEQNNFSRAWEEANR